MEELKDRITAKEYKSWLRYYQVKGPFGERRLDFNFASLVKTIYEFITANAGRTDAPSVEDCLLQFKLPVAGLSEMGANHEAENIKRLLVKYEKYRK
jgi:hypothetical protein